MIERLHLEAFWRIAGEFVDSLNSVFMAQAMGQDDPGPELTEDERSDLIERLHRLKGLCEKVGLSTSASLIEMKLRVLPTGTGEMDMLWLTVQSEMKSSLFLSVPREKRAYFNMDTPLTPAAMATFPKAAQELRNAGNAFVSDLPTASVFHCMRALEYGLRALAADVQAEIGTATWHTIITRIESKIDESRNARRGEEKDARLQFLSEAAAEFRYFKDGWRNYASHVKIDYDDAQAARVMQHVGTFIELLSTQLVEAA